MADLPVLPLSDPSFWQDIYPDLAEARDRSKVVATDEGGLYAIGYDEVDAVLKSPKFAAADLLGMMGLSSGPVWEWWNRLMFSNNDPFHSRIRRLVTRAFTPRRIETERPRIRAMADKLVAQALESGQADFMHSVAHHLPSQAMSEIFRIPESDRDKFHDWTTDIGLAFGAAGDPEVRARVEDALAHLDEYASQLVEDRRRSPGDDLLSELIAVEEQGDRLSTREMIDLVENLLFAGHDTTRGAIGTMTWLLHSHPDQLQALRDDPGLVPNAVEEVLRYEAITFSTARAAVEDTEVAGVPVAAGMPLGLCIPAASRDAQHYPDPDRFDIRRPDVRPPAFGAGAHYCIGAALARTELQEMLSSLLTSTRSFTVLEPPRWVPFAHIRRYERLDVSLDAA